MVPFFKGDRYRQKYELIGNGGNTSLNTIEKILIDADWYTMIYRVKKSKESFVQMGI